MITFRFLSILLLVGVNFSHIGFSQVASKGTVFLLRVESTDPENVHIRFSSAYAYQGSEHSHPLVIGEQETPFETKLSGTYFLGMFSGTSGDNNIKVLLVMFTNGVKSAEAGGSGPLNILHADPTGIGYGWPSTFRDLSSLEHRFDSLDLKEKWKHKAARRLTL